MGSRSRKRRRSSPAATSERPAPAPSRSEQRAEEARAALEPLEPGERPTAVTVAAAVAAVIALANVGFLLGGWEVRGEQPSTAGVVGFSVLMLADAFYMLKGRYWAVLGFQCLVALSCIVAGMSLLVASNLQAIVLCLAILGAGGALFWFLVKAMARLQMPERPGARRTG